MNFGGKEDEKGEEKKKKREMEAKQTKKKVHLKVIKPHFLPLHQKSLLFQ